MILRPDSNARRVPTAVGTRAPGDGAIGRPGATAAPGGLSPTVRDRRRHTQDRALESGSARPIGRRCAVPTCLRARAATLRRRDARVSDFPEYFRAVEPRALPSEFAQTDPRTAELRDAYLIPLAITSILDAPILKNGEMIGVVCHEHVGTPRGGPRKNATSRCRWPTRWPGRSSRRSS